MNAVEQREFDQLAARVEKLERIVQENLVNRAPSLPIYDQTNWPLDAFEGQVVIAPVT